MVLQKPKRRQKVLLMGRSGSGKTSMRQVIFNPNYGPKETQRLGATLDTESSNVHLLNGLSLNIWDCAGQGSYMDTYLDNARRVTFQGVAILIYVFDTTSTEWESDVSYFERVLEGLREYSVEEEEEDGEEEEEEEDDDGSEESGSGSESDGSERRGKQQQQQQLKKKKKRERPGVYILINKMDLEDPSQRERIEREKARPLVDMVREIVGGKCKAFGTSIWDESLYRAWSAVVRTLLPNASLLTHHLSLLRSRASATQVVLFEKQSFLVIARSRSLPRRVLVDGVLKRPKVKETRGEDGEEDGEEEEEGAIGWKEDGRDVGEEKRFELMSETIKSFRKQLTDLLNASWQTWEANFPNCSVAISQLTQNTFCLILSNDQRADSAYLIGNIEAARRHFEEVLGGTGIVRLKCPICKDSSSIRYQYEPPAVAAVPTAEEDVLSSEMRGVGISA